MPLKDFRIRGRERPRFKIPFLGLMQIQFHTSAASGQINGQSDQ
ncbi:hypothetical protein D1AOALGA4SA_6510 [Olavius algarvensis Delta 1 endosymbiont]|nr:hypothetical protein D1AOALGA4SA_6510 [Olavius algarvensis Delta 1 endosymbiont]